MRRTSLLLILLCGLIVAPALAQENPTEPAPELVFYPEDFLSFPQSLFLRLGIELPTVQIASLTLAIQPEDRETITLTFPQDEPFEVAGDFTIARYTWLITDETAPPLFGEIRYTWRLTTTANETQQISRTVSYTDNRVAWRTETGDDFLLTLPDNVTEANATISAQPLNTISTRLKQNTGQSVTLKWLVFPPNIPPGCRLDDDGNPVVLAVAENLTKIDIPCDVGLANRIYQQAGYTVFRLEKGEALQTRLLREIITGYYAPLWAASDAPAWFRSGIERLYVPPGNQALVISRQALRSGAPLSPAEMAALPGDDSSGIWEAQSYGMVAYLMDKLGVEPVIALARTAAATPFVEAYQAATGETLDTLILDWQTWLFTNRAAAAYAYSIFAPTTPTPTATFTPTLTRTPLPPTETPTQTPDYSPTPRPTRTRIPPSPTITPLPAQSFTLRPTALPSPTPIPLLDQPIPGLPVNKGQLAMAGGGFVLVLLLIIFGLLWRSRRISN